MIRRCVGCRRLRRIWAISLCERCFIAYVHQCQQMQNNRHNEES